MRVSSEIRGGRLQEWNGIDAEEAVGDHSFPSGLKPQPAVEMGSLYSGFWERG